MARLFLICTTVEERRARGGTWPCEGGGGGGKGAAEIGPGGSGYLLGEEVVH